MADEIRDRELTALESRLFSLAPQPSALDRDSLLWQAGRASVRKGWFWQAATGFLVVVVAGFSVAPLFRPITRVDPVVVYVPVEKPAAVAEPTTPVANADSPVANAPGSPASVVALDDHWRTDSENLRLRDQILRFGIESLPASRSASVAEKPLPLDPLLGFPPSSLNEVSTRLLLRPILHSGF